MKAGKINSLHRNMHFRKACPGDYEEIMAILASGRDAQRKFGFRQWGDDFPSGTTVSNDIITGSGYIMEIDGLTAGYAAIFVSDSEYERLSHIWLKKGPYAVAHRVAISDAFRGRGMACVLIAQIEKVAAVLGTKSMRFDTGVDNLPMQRSLEKSHYENLGIHDFVWGRRIAYEKLL